MTPAFSLLHHRVSCFQGGTEVRCLGEAQWLTEAGFRVTLFAAHQGRSPAWQKFLQKCSSMSSPKIVELSVPAPGSVEIEEEFRLAAEAAAPFLPMGSEAVTMVYFSSLLLHLPRSQRTILRVQGVPPTTVLRNGIARMGDSLRGILCNSRQGQEIARKAAQGAWCGPIAYLPGGICPPSPRPSGAVQHSFDICSNLRLIERKSPDLLCEALSFVFAARPVTRAVILGDGPLRPAVEQRMHQALAAGSLTLVGEIPHHKVEHMLRSSRVLLHTAREDACPNAVQEAMREGLPVVAPGLDSLTDLVANERTGLLAPPAEAGTGLGLRLLRLLENDALRVQLGNEAAREARRFYWNAVGPRLADTLGAMARDWNPRRFTV